MLLFTQSRQVGFTLSITKIKSKIKKKKYIHHGYHQNALIFFISNQGQALALKVAYIFTVFGAQSCLMIAQWFDQVTYVCEECINLQDSKLVFMITNQVICFGIQKTLCQFKYCPIHRTKITYHLLLIDFFHKLISMQDVAHNMLHSHLAQQMPPLYMHQ